MAKNIILFGAGASFGSGHILPKSPPLGRDLYSELAVQFPASWGALHTEWRETFTQDFEAGMWEVMNSGNHAIGPLMRATGWYFASFATDGSGRDAYSLLLKEARNAGLLGSVLFSTLNYECLFELAASRLGIPIDYNDPPLATDRAIIWKLHGSCNFQPDPEAITMRQGVSYAYGVTAHVPLIRRNPHEIKQWLESDNALYPAMCLYAANKPSQIAPEVFEEYWRVWGERVRGAENVFVVGSRPHPQDRHVWTPLANTPARLYVVGSQSGLEKWLPNRTGGDTTFLGREFQTSIGVMIEHMAH